MKKMFAASVLVAVLTASTVFAAEQPSTTQPVKGTEGPDIRLTQDDESSQPVRGIEGPDVR